MNGTARRNRAVLAAVPVYNRAAVVCSAARHQIAAAHMTKQHRPRK